MENYAELQAHFSRVRRAWRRARALQGLSRVVIEAAGLLLLFALADHFYAMPQPARILVLACISSVLAVLVALHVVRPLTRKISDDQIALYIEEHQQADGALLTAASLGQAHGQPGSSVSRFILERVMQSAVSKAGTIRLSELLDLRKLRKYGIAALLLLLILGISAIRYSRVFGRSVNRLLLPWELTDDDRKALDPAYGEPQLQFELCVEGGTRVLRGSAVTIKAKLSLRPGGPVVLKYRSGAADFHTLKLDEIDELNTFALRLPDLNDDLDFFVQAGNHRSEQRTISIYDRIEFKDFQITLTPPAYAQLETKTERTGSGDISALTGTRVQLRAAATAPLASGTLNFSDGTQLTLKADENAGAVAAEFVLEKDTSYSISLTARDGQTLTPAQSFTVKTLPDEPPTVAVEAPGSDLEVHACAEVDFSVKAADDIGLAKVTLNYTVSSDESHPVSLPLKLYGKPAPGDRTLACTLALSELGTPIHAGDSIMYYVSAKDLKGQETVSDLFTIQVRPFEVLVALPKKGGHAPDHESFASLLQFIATAWNIHTQQPHTPEAEYNQRCENLAAQIMKVDRAHLFEGGEIPNTESARKVSDAAFSAVLGGVEALRRHDALKGVNLLRQGLMLFKRVSVSANAIAPAAGGKQYSSFAGGDPMRQSLGSIDIAPPPIHENDPPFFSHPVKPDYLRQINMEDARKVRDLAQKLKKQQQKLVDEARKLVEHQNDKGGDGEDRADQQAGNAQPQKEQKQGEKQNPTGDAQAQAGAPGNNAETPQTDAPKAPGDDAIADRNERLAALQHEQEGLAKEVQNMNQQLAGKNANAGHATKAAAEDLRKTAAEMQEAVEQIRHGNLQRAAAHGEEAVKDLTLADERLKAGQFDQLDEAVAAAEDRAQQLADNQKKIRDATQRVLDDAKKRNEKAGGGKNTAMPELNAQDQQKLKGIAHWQTENQKNAGNLQDYIGELAQWADSAKQKDTAEALRKAARTMKLDKVGDNMVDIAVDLGMNELDGAADAQAKLDKALNKVTGQLQEATGALAQTGEQKLKRALSDAKGLLDKAQALAQANGTARNDADPAQQAPAAPTNEPANKDSKAVKDASAERHDPDAGNVQQSAAAPKPGQAPLAGAAPAKKDAALTAGEKRELQDELFRGTARLARRLEQDKLAPGAQARFADALRDEKSFLEMFKEGQQTRLDRYLGSIAEVSTTLEGKLEASLKARRLSSGQREQTPAQYREMVNSYYQRLASQ